MLKRKHLPLLQLKSKRPSLRRKPLRSLRRLSQNQWSKKKPLLKRKLLRRIQSLLRQAPVRTTSPLKSKREEPSTLKLRREALRLALRLKTLQMTNQL
jgi:hypothetical protein